MKNSIFAIIYDHSGYIQIEIYYFVLKFIMKHSMKFKEFTFEAFPFKVSVSQNFALSQ